MSMNECTSCSKPLQFKAMTSIVYGFIPSCNKNTFECTNCKTTIVRLNWFLINFYFLLGTILILETIFLGFKMLPLLLNLFNIIIGLGAYAMIVKGFRLRLKSN